MLFKRINTPKRVQELLLHFHTQRIEGEAIAQIELFEKTQSWHSCIISNVNKLKTVADEINSNARLKFLKIDVTVIYF